MQKVFVMMPINGFEPPTRLRIDALPAELNRLEMYLTVATPGLARPERIRIPGYIATTVLPAIGMLRRCQVHTRF